MMQQVCPNTKSKFTNTNYFEKENIVVLSNDSLNKNGNTLAFNATLFNLGLAKKESLKKDHILINFKTLKFEQTKKNMSSYVSPPIFRLKFLPGFENAKIITPNPTFTATMPIVFLQDVTSFELESLIALMKQSDKYTRNLLFVIIQSTNHSGTETNGLQAYRNVIVLYNPTDNPTISFEYMSKKGGYIKVEYKSSYDSYFYKFGIPLKREAFLYNETDVETEQLDFMLTFNSKDGIHLTSGLNIIPNVKEKRVTTSESWVKFENINDNYFHKLYHYIHSGTKSRSVVFIKEFIHPSLSSLYPDATEIYVHVEIDLVREGTYPPILELIEQICRDEKITAVMVTHLNHLENFKPPPHIMKVKNSTTEYSSANTYSKNDVIFYPTPDQQETNQFKYKATAKTLFVTDKSDRTTPHFKILKNVVDSYGMRHQLARMVGNSEASDIAFKYGPINLLFMTVFTPT